MDIGLRTAGGELPLSIGNAANMFRAIREGQRIAVQDVDNRCDDDEAGAMASALDAPVDVVRTVNHGAHHACGRR